jgi:hypothetical protein
MRYIYNGCSVSGYDVRFIQTYETGDTAVLHTVLLLSISAIYKVISLSLMYCSVPVTDLSS